jgi:prepilin-type N-terminal cleavage/methylation domain-containing protein
MGRIANRHSRGFTILELMIGMSIFLIISGAVLIGMRQVQQNYRSAEVSTQMQQQLRSTMELIAAEIGQAGLQSSNAEGANTMGDASVTAPYLLTQTVTATGVQTVNVTTNGSAPYIGQWLMLADGANQEALQVTSVPAGQIVALFGHTHTPLPASGSFPMYPMGVFPHGILAGSTINSLSDPSSSVATGGGKLAMYGEINGSGNGLWAVEYTCPSSFPGALTRKAWNLSAFTGSGFTGTQGTAYNLIDNVTACYFCWPGVTTAQNANCPQGAAPPDTVTLQDGVNVPTYSIITQVGFTITVTEPVTISGTTQNVTVTKSYSNIQPRNLITADKIYNAACTSANAGVSVVPCPIPYGTYASWIFGELQPDPLVIGWMNTNSIW